MMNVVSIMGRIVATPELRKTQSGISVTNFTIANERDFQNKGEEKQTDFIEVVAWRNTAEFLCKYFVKGQLIGLNGRLQTKNYQDKEGNKRKAYEVLADNVYFAEGKKNSNNSEPTVEYSQGDTEDFTEISDDQDLPF